MFPVAVVKPSDIDPVEYACESGKYLGWNVLLLRFDINFVVS